MTHVTLKQIREGIKEGATLFFVHASWCPYTVQFYPIFQTVMNNLKKQGIDKQFNVIKLDDTMTRSIQSHHKDIYKHLADYDSNVDEYKLYFPTVVMFVNGKRFKYQVAVRTVDNFNTFITSKLNKTIKRKDTRKLNRLQKEREDKHQKSRMVSFNNNKTKTRPIKLLTLEEQIDKAFKKLFK